MKKKKEILEIYECQNEECGYHFGVWLPDEPQECPQCGCQDFEFFNKHIYKRSPNSNDEKT